MIVIDRILSLDGSSPIHNGAGGVTAGLRNPSTQRRCDMDSDCTQVDLCQIRFWDLMTSEPLSRLLGWLRKPSNDVCPRLSRALHNLTVKNGVMSRVCAFC